jgi:ABC-type transporter Mla subunit MlaD
MSPEHLDVSFGAKYEGLPRINLAGAAFEAADEQLGAAKAIADAAGDQVTAALNEGVDELDALIADALEDLIDQLLQDLGVDVFDPLYQEMMDTYADARASGKSFNQWLGALDTTFDEYFDGTVGNYSKSLRGKLDKLAAAGDEAMSMINRARGAVDKGISAIDAITREIDGHDGLLKEDSNGQRHIVQLLVHELIKQLAGDEIASALSGVVDDATSDFNQKLNELLEDMDPTFDQLVDVLEQLRGYLVQVRTALNGAGEIVHSFQDIVNQASTELDAIVTQVRTEAHDFINELATSAQMVVTESLDAYGSIFDDFSQDTFRGFLTAQIRDMLLQSSVYQQFQYVLRQWVSDLDMAMHNAIDSVFAEVQNLVKEVIDEALGPIDDAINETLGDIDKYLGAGSVQGSANFNGDSLKRLRLDGEFQFKIPDDMELHAYLEILCYESGDDFAASGCLEPGEKAVEVKLGATDVGVDWLSPDMRADMEVKFSMMTSPKVEPRGVGGSFEMTGGSLNFEAFKITEFGAAVGVGTDECYIAAEARMVFSKYELAGGIFFGRTCTLDPLLLIDKDVAELLGTPPFTGAYVYGEVWLPISEMVLGIPASCMFNISAGVGAGAFYFVEGPTWGGQMLLGVSGEALCVVSIKGTVKMIGVMAGDSLRFSGRGTLTGKAGACPFCIKFSKSAKMSYQDGDWSVDL